MGAPETLGALAVRWDAHPFLGARVQEATQLWAWDVSQDRAEPRPARRAAELILAAAVLDQQAVDAALDEIVTPQRKLDGWDCGYYCDCLCHVRVSPDGCCDWCADRLIADRDAAVENLIAVMAGLFCENRARLLRDMEHVA